MNNRIFYICGPDGSGKTTFIEMLEEYFKIRNEKVIHIWLRSPKLFSKPLMGYCRLVKLTKYRYVNGIRVGGHEFYRSKMVSKIFPWLQLIDFKIFNFFKIKKNLKSNKIIIMDRYVLDTLVDLMIDIKNYNLLNEKIGRHFVKMLPNNIKIIILDADESTLKNRRLDIKYDSNLPVKRKLFKKLSKKLHLPIIDNSQSIEQVKNEIWSLWGLENE
jgi:thymidylate kinase